MKKSIASLVLAVLATFALTACQSATQLMDNAIPDGKAKSVVATVTGKWSSTQFTAENFEKTPDKVKADVLHFRHSDAYVPLIEIEYKGYERERETKK